MNKTNVLPAGNRLLIIPDKIEDLEDHGAFVAVKTKKDSLLRGLVVGAGSGHLNFWINRNVYFGAYGYEQVGEYVIVDVEDVHAYDNPID